MPQLVHNANIFNRTSGGPAGEIRRPNQTNVLSEVSQLLGVVGQASDTIDKLGNNELAKMAAAGIREGRRKALIAKHGVPTIDPAHQERTALVQKALEGTLPNEAPQLQEPTMDAGVQTMGNPQAGGVLNPGQLSLGSNLPGELSVPLPGQEMQLSMGGILGQGLQQEMAAQNPVQGGVLERGAAGSAGQLQLDPRTGQPMVPEIEVADKHLPAQIQVFNREQALQLAAEHYDDPMVLAQLADSAARLQGISPRGLFGLVTGDAEAKFRRDLMKATELGRHRAMGLQKARQEAMIQMGKLAELQGMNAAKRQKMAAEIYKIGTVGKLNQATTRLRAEQEKLTRAKRLNPGKFQRITNITTKVSNKNPSWMTKTVQSEFKLQRQKFWDAQKEAATLEANLKGSAKGLLSEIVTSSTRNFEQYQAIDNLKKNKSRLEDMAAELAKAFSTQSAVSVLQRYGKQYLKFKDKDKNKILSNVRSAIKGLDSGIRNGQSKLDADIEKYSKSLNDKADKEKILQAKYATAQKNLKRRKGTFAEANRLQQAMLAYRQNPSAELLTGIIDMMMRLGAIRDQDLTGDE